MYILLPIPIPNSKSQEFYLINYGYFNNLNGDQYYNGDMYIPLPIPIPNSKSQEFLIPILNECGDSPSKR